MININEDTIDRKVGKAKEILGENAKVFNKSIAILFTGSKETTIVLDLVRDMNNGKIPFPIVHIDTGLETEELYDYRTTIQREWDIEIEIVSRQGFLSPDKTFDTEECCKKLTEEGLREALRQHGWKALIFDPKNSGFEGIVESGISVINPVAHFDELDCWRYIKQRDLPYCSLYRKGFKLVACEPCLRPWLRKIELDNENKEEIINRLKSLGYL